MPKVLKWLDNKLEPILINILFITFTLIVIIEVFRRYALNDPSNWSEELARYIFVYLIYIAAAYAVKTGSHLRIDLLLLNMKPKVRIYFETLADVCFAILALGVIYYSTRFMALFWEMGTLAQARGLMDLDFNMAFAYASQPLGWGLVTLRLIQREVGMWRRYLKTGQLVTVLRVGE